MLCPVPLEFADVGSVIFFIVATRAMTIGQKKRPLVLLYFPSHAVLLHCRLDWAGRPFDATLRPIARDGARGRGPAPARNNFAGRGSSPV